MSTTTGPTRPAKSHGQWAVDGDSPLNANEVMKQEGDGLAVRERVETIYAKQGFDSIPGDDLRGRLRWWGLYTQRKPGIDGGRTAALEPEELEDSNFLMRVRSDGGRLTLEQLRTIANISVEFAQDTADVTDRQNIQLHWIRIEDVPEIWRRLEAVGLSSAQACGDVPRVILGSPVAGVAVDEIIDGTPAIEEILRRYLLDPELANLPRKFKSAISGSPRLDVAHEINDISFVGVVHPEHGPGFDLWVGGGLSTNPHLAVRLGAWVPIDEVADVWLGVVKIFRDYGYRRLRTKARLKFLVSDWGAEKFRQVLETEYLGRPLIDGPAPSTALQRDHVGVFPQTNGQVYVGAAPTVGRLSGTRLLALADIAEAAGSDRVHLTADQKVVVLNVDQANVDSLTTALSGIGLEVHPSQFRRSTMACTGVEYCKLAITNTKDRATALVAELESRLPDNTLPLAVHVNGCPNSCARIQVADIGLKGMRALDADGNDVEGFQIHLGGRLGQDSGFGRTVKGLRLPADDLPDYVERVFTRYIAERDGDETFSHWALRADDEAIR
ncbi:MAG: nitrite/sulfite reductase [Candidatus Nanopelagicales bacterium]|nr:nitrite/sulfite reductase [Candidatus Nanopelagicales bacterium]